MLTSADLRGVCAMMPAFATDDASDVHARNTIDFDRLSHALNRIIDDGIDMIGTTGSFGENSTLLWSEHQDLIRATVETVRHRVPVFVGIACLNTRDALEKLAFIRASGADGVLAAVPFYYPSTVDNAVQFYLDLADEYPDFPVMIYHNPPIHRVRLPVDAFKTLTTRRNIVAMKDSHRDVLEFAHLMEAIDGRMSVFVNQSQMYPFGFQGAAGCWSIYAWMGPGPVLRLRDACRAGDEALAKEICMAMSARSHTPVTDADLHWRENGHKYAINAAGYCNVGPLRPPFRNVPPEVAERGERVARKWLALVEKYAPVAI